MFENVIVNEVHVIVNHYLGRVENALIARKSRLKELLACLSALMNLIQFNNCFKLLLGYFITTMNKYIYQHIL